MSENLYQKVRRTLRMILPRSGLGSSLDSDPEISRRTNQRTGGGPNAERKQKLPDHTLYQKSPKKHARRGICKTTWESWREVTESRRRRDHRTHVESCLGSAGAGVGRLCRRK